MKKHAYDPDEAYDEVMALKDVVGDERAFTEVIRVEDIINPDDLPF